jgi:hypothetical protein
MVETSSYGRSYYGDYGYGRGYELHGRPRHAAARAQFDPVLQFVTHLRQGLLPGRGRSKPEPARKPILPRMPRPDPYRGKRLSRVVFSTLAPSSPKPVTQLVRSCVGAGTAPFNVALYPGGMPEDALLSSQMERGRR